jgi:hypothetical protein
MAKGKRKARTEAERAEIEADRIAAHEAVTPSPEDVAAYEAQQAEEDKMTAEELFEVQAPDEAIVGSNVQVGEFDEANVEELDEVALAEGEIEGEEKPEPNSVVKDKFKTKYIENAIAQGVTHKAAKRSNWDWLSQQIAAYCLDDKHSIDIVKFLSLLDANGVDHSKWTNRNRGWEGRLRMTGRVALQKVVAESGWLKFPDNEEATDISELAPPEWRAKYKAKG